MVSVGPGAVSQAREAVNQTMALVLAGADLRVGAWVLAAGWALVGGYAIVAPGLKGYIQPEQEVADADHRPVG